MGTRENKVERHLNASVEEIGGVTRKWVSPGRDGVPDRIVIYKGRVVFVEVKTTDGKLSPCQVREHKRLRFAGADVVTVYGEEEVNDLIWRLICGS